MARIFDGENAAVPSQGLVVEEVKRLSVAETSDNKRAEVSHIEDS